MAYRHLSLAGRGKIQVLLQKGYGARAIARELGRSPSTISRELGRNRGRAPDGYDPEKAQERYKQERKACARRLWLEYKPLMRYVLDKLMEGYSPEQIAGRLPKDFSYCPEMGTKRAPICAMWQGVSPRPADAGVP